MAVALLFLLVSVLWFLAAALLIDRDAVDAGDIRWDDTLETAQGLKGFIRLIILLGPIAWVLGLAWLTAWDLKNYQIERGFFDEEEPEEIEKPAIPQTTYRCLGHCRRTGITFQALMCMPGANKCPYCTGKVEKEPQSEAYKDDPLQ